MKNGIPILEALSMPDPTLKEAADQLGLTKNTVKGRLQKAPEGSTYKGEDGILHLTAAGMAWLTGTTDNRSETGSGTDDNQQNHSETSSEPVITALVEALQNQLEEKDRQIQRLQDHIDQLTLQNTDLADAVRGAQALHAGDIQKQLSDTSSLPNQQTSSEHRHWWQIWKR